ncbi:hypothetical protein H704_01065 [Bartonella bacilliformis Peru38]|uniref:DUF1561 domain-containing protein n=2 Tax=Bartonella bacilliformis TaxID=774 RepID=A1UTY8_BARBK|nr:DUF1561 family protein [Bartonella bacilliformis]ABM45220.1 conserved hypothetical protein [Bartonella bacilliformis KC583]AMG86178.1 DUF1561 domain-containing protein [Bartonella bacilliformis]EKS43075.1 hypothetical protein BbINS_05552 [Bartonella bacilliformis INS]EYS89047.1 hypothetical protein X472_01137 [Bartonella bacilliformis San Pedro600-02]EYS95749.1 hypothetical protein X470_00340 [Bartonella bacilliformis Peru-18]
MKWKILLFFFSLLLTARTSLGAPVPGVIQTPPNHPEDKAIQVKVHTGKEYCYAPVFTKGEGYIYIDNCNSSSVKKARYDLFQRVAWEVNDTWLCMTAPSSITGIDGNSTTDWDYLLLRPCVLNDPNQRWVIENRIFYTADKKFRVKDYNWYAYISKDKSAYYDHTLTPQMDSWIKRIVTPVNLSFKTSIAWLFINVYPPVFQLYYLQNNSSSLSETPLYYNPENGHIAQYYPNSGYLYCMASKQSLSQNWNWVEWTYCTDEIPKKKDSAFWDLSQLDGRDGFILDFNRNALRVTQHGPHWGVPYTAKPDYLEKDTTNSPKSKFMLSPGIEQWNLYVNGNLGKTLTYCPAPGNKENVAQPSKTRVKRHLPPDFTLTPEWIRRLWQIATSTAPGRQEEVGYCGACTLHTAQMLAELLEHYQGPPLRDGGYFFNTQGGTDPFLSFRQRYPGLTARLETTRSYATVPLSVGESRHERAHRAAHLMMSMLLPDYLWRSSATASTSQDMQRTLRDLVNLPPGTIGFLLISRANAAGTGRIAHVQPFVTTHQGFTLIITNTLGIPLERYRTLLTPTTDPARLLYYLSTEGRRHIYAITTFQMVGFNAPPLSVFMSQRNCTGEGEHRRGNGEFPNTATINQCGSGRCM